MATSSRIPHLDSTATDAGKLLLRVLIGALILLHGIAKIKSGPAMMIDTVTRAGLPEALAYAVYVGEVVAPLLMIVGSFTRLAALIIAGHMATAVALAHVQQLLTLAPSGGWAVELQALYLFGALAVALLGAGRFSAGGTFGRWN
ncbi:MAG: DoxX family protein [Burkholderiales bacterium]|nr:DoxX family protein [Burkholderiales bacterium]